jgi:hypothetical protein
MKAAGTRHRGSCGAGAGVGELLKIMSVVPGAGSILHDSPERSEVEAGARGSWWVAGAALFWLLVGHAEEGGEQGRVGLPDQRPD